MIEIIALVHHHKSVSNIESYSKYYLMEIDDKG